MCITTKLETAGSNCSPLKGISESLPCLVRKGACQGLIECQGFFGSCQSKNVTQYRQAISL
jgi:hypothetical protein